MTNKVWESAMDCLGKNRGEGEREETKKFRPRQSHLFMFSIHFYTSS